MHKFLLFALIGMMLSSCASYTATSSRVAVKDDSAANAGRVAVKENSAAIVVRFSAGDRAVIEDYYRKSAPAKSSPGSMPLLKGGWLPADIGAEPLPPALERKLSPLPSSHERQKVGRSVVLIEKKTRVIADVLYNTVK
ncbi:MAG: hypothetical protein WB402_12680 [Sulfuricaulis sp.]|uniref:hypothetical protein n=1 Tax=Sulfuricaulis sp. TaxID=2003553 RepID=UPI003C5460F2